MRLIFLDPATAIGGAERVLLDLIASLQRCRPAWELILVAPGEGALIDAARAAGIACIISPYPARLMKLGDYRFATDEDSRGRTRSLTRKLVWSIPEIASYALTLGRLLSDLQPDIVHSNGLKAHFLSAWTAPNRAALLWHIHDYVNCRPVTRRLLRISSNRPKAMIANSRSVTDDLRKAIRSGRSICTIHNGLDLDRFKPEGPRLDLDALGGFKTAEVIRVGMVATTARWKGHELFIRALAALPKSIPIRGYILGAPIYSTHGSQYSLDELRALARDCGADDRICFTGHVAESADVFRALDIVVHASTEPEPFGLVIAEAFACGRAVITSALGGAAELIEPERDAIVFRSNDVGSLADAILRLVCEPETRRMLGQAARAAAERRFDRMRMAQEFIAAYESLLPAGGDHDKAAARP